ARFGMDRGLLVGNLTPARWLRLRAARVLHRCPCPPSRVGYPVPPDRDGEDWIAHRRWTALVAHTSPGHVETTLPGQAGQRDRVPDRRAARVIVEVHKCVAARLERVGDPVQPGTQRPPPVLGAGLRPAPVQPQLPEVGGTPPPRPRPPHPRGPAQPPAT